MRPARRAMLAMMETEGKDDFAHPMFWALFVVVGEGGARGGALPSSPHCARNAGAVT